MVEVRDRVHNFVNTLFTTLDTNGDGSIIKEEMRAQMEQVFEPLPQGMASGMEKDA